MGYRVERIAEVNFDSFLHIFEATFSKKADSIYFKAKFDTAFARAKYIGFIAFEEASNAPAAFYGVFPTLVRMGDKQVLAAQSGDTATHPDHRKKGLFNILHDKTMELCIDEGIAFVYGFPNEQSFPGFLKFGWTHACDSINSYWVAEVSFLKKLYRKLAPAAFESSKMQLLNSKKVPLAAYAKIDWESSFLASYSKEVCVSRSAEYLTYKQKLGAELIQLESGYAWVSYKDNELRVGDLFGKNFELIFKELLDFCKRCGIDVLSIKCSHQDVFSIFEKQFPTYKKEKAGALIINHLANSMPLKDEQFLYTGGDFDTF